MSHKSGDRARADKQSRRRRVRRAMMRPLRKAISSAKPRVAPATVAENTQEPAPEHTQEPA